MKMRAKIIIVLAATLILTTIVILPRITKAGRFKWFGGGKTPLAILALASNPGQDLQAQKPDITSGASIQNDTSPNLRDMKPAPYVGKGEEREAAENPKIPHFHKDRPDMVVQDRTASLMAFIAPSIPNTTLNFDGI